MTPHTRSPEPATSAKPIVLLLSLVFGPPLAVSHCTPEGPRVSIEDETRPLYFEQVLRGQNAALEDTIETVIKDNETWSAYDALLAGAATGASVNFDELMVILAAVPASSGGYDISFRSVEEAGDVIIAHYVLGVPDEDCLTAMGVTVPFQAVAVRKIELPVVFERAIERVRCTFR